MNTSSAFTKQLTYEQILKSFNAMKNLPPQIDYIKIRESFYTQLSKEVGFPLAGTNDSVNHLYGCQYKVVSDDEIKQDYEVVYR